MPVDHPASHVGVVRVVRAPGLIFALSFLVTLGLLMALSPLIDKVNFFN